MDIVISVDKGGNILYDNCESVENFLIIKLDQGLIEKLRELMDRTIAWKFFGLTMICC